MLLFLFFWLNTPSMNIQINNIQSASGQVLIALYQQEDGFMSLDKAVFKQAYPITKKGAISIDLPELIEGNYAISCFHDLNNNGVLDKNMLGIPTEPYGFSQGVRPKFRAPTWDEAKFKYKKGGQVGIWLEKW